MLTTALRLLLSLAGTYANHPAPGDAAHEAAHVLCERAVYGAVAPRCTTDACIDAAAEAVATVLCRYEVAGEPWAR